MISLESGIRHKSTMTSPLLESDFEFLDETRTLRKFLSRRWLDPLRAATANDMPKVSVIMPSFNQVAFIERSILSVLNQNYPNLELIIVDGGSTDGTLEVVERYRDSIDYFHSGPDRGQSDALNHGFTKATGDIFAWLNSDDVYLPGAMLAAAKAFHQSPSASVVFGDWWSIGSDDNVIEISYAFDFSLRHFIYEGFHLNSQAMFWRRNVHQRYGEFDEQLHRTMDYDLIVRFGINEGQDKFLRVPQVLAGFRRHPEQKTTNDGQDVVANEHRLVAIKNGFPNKYSTRGKLFRLIYRVRRAWWYLYRGGIEYTWWQVTKG